MNEHPQPLSDSQFRDYCHFVYQEVGIKLTEEKRALLNARLAKRLRCLSMSPECYFGVIQRDHIEKGRFIDAVSTNHTFFFRESRSFRVLSDNCHDIWCAASSSGEEPYSLAIHCLNMGVAPSVYATDISESCLKKAGQGIYPDQCLNAIPDNLVKTYFQKGRNQWAGYVRIKPEVKKLIRFGKFNLLSDPVPDHQFDAIFCRNVMIYFDAPTKEHVVRRLFSVLKPRGYFVIGGAESLSGLTHGLTYIEPSVYQKP